MLDLPGAVPWQRRGTTIRLDLKVVPNARAEKADGLAADADRRPRLVLRLTAPPVDGKANAAVIAFLAKALGCPRAALAITSGQASRQKRVTWTDPPPDAEARLQHLTEGRK